MDNPVDKMKNKKAECRNISAFLFLLYRFFNIL